MRHVSYGPGGFKPEQDDDNITSDVEVEIPSDPQELLREAITNANNLAELKQALLGDDTNPGAQARRDGRGIG